MKTVSQPENSITKPLNSPVRILISVLASILIIESILLLVYTYFMPGIDLKPGFIDSILLIVILYPVLYVLVFRPVAKSLAISREAQQALARSEEKYRFLTENSSDAIWHIDLNYTLTYMSQADERMRGFRREEVINQPIWSLLKPEGVELVKKLNAERLINESKGIITGSVLLELEQICKNGQWIWTEVSSSPFRDSTGKLTGYHGVTRDISVRRQAQQELLKFKLGLEYSTDAIFITDTDGVITYANAAFEKLYGFTSDQIIGKTPRLIKSGVLAEEVYGHFWEKLLNKEIVAGEIINKAQNGRMLTIDGTNNPIIDYSGKLIGFLGVHRDITQRKKDELKKEILSEIVHGITTTSDLNQLLQLIHLALKKIMYAENCFFALYDHETGLFSFPYFVDKYDTAPDARSLYKSCTAYVFHSGQSSLINTEFFNKLVNEQKVELVGSNSPSWLGIPLKTSSGIIGVLVLQNYEDADVYSNDDLTFLDSIGSQVANVIERKRAEKELEQSYSLLTATLESTADGILVVDKSGKITNYNQRFVELWQIPPSVISTRNDNQIISFVLEQVKDPTGFEAKIHELYVSGVKESLDIIDFKDGRIFERYSHAQLFQGQSVGRVWSFRDITERTLIEMEINLLNQELENRVTERTSQLQKANKELEAFSYSASHELRTPLRALDGFANILLQDYSNVLDDEGKRMLNIIIENANRMGDLIDDLISVSGLNKQELKTTEVDMYALVHAVYHQLAINHDTSRVVFKVNPLPVVYGDASLLRLLWYNLIDNAIKFSVSRTVPVIEIASVKQAGEVVFSIKDNGIGFEMANSVSMFNIFKRLHVAKEYDGRGLGLAIVKQVVLRHNGHVWAEGKPGEGAIIYFALQAM